MKLSIIYKNGEHFLEEHVSKDGILVFIDSVIWEEVNLVFLEANSSNFLSFHIVEDYSEVLCLNGKKFQGSNSIFSKDQVIYSLQEFYSSKNTYKSRGNFSHLVESKMREEQLTTAKIEAGKILRREMEEARTHKHSPQKGVGWGLSVGAVIFLLAKLVIFGMRPSSPPTYSFNSNGNSTSLTPHKEALEIIILDFKKDRFQESSKFKLTYRDLYDYQNSIQTVDAIFNGNHFEIGDTAKLNLIYLQNSEKPIISTLSKIN